MGRVGTVRMPQNMASTRRAMPTQKRVVSIAKGNAKPRTVEEARLVLVYMEEQRKIRQAKELEAKKALLAFERGTGTTARVKQALRSLPTTSASARVEAERRARQKIGSAIRRLRGFRL